MYMIQDNRSLSPQLMLDNVYYCLTLCKLANALHLSTTGGAIIMAAAFINSITVHTNRYTYMISAGQKKSFHTEYYTCVHAW